LKPFTANKPLVDDIVEFLKDYLEKVATNKASALTVPLVPSKPRKPLTPQSRNRLYGDYLSAYGKKKAVTPIEKL
jgi:ribosomal protein S30